MKNLFSSISGHIPNQLTLLRIAIVPVILMLYPLDFVILNYICAFLFALAAWTDFFDGYLARRWKMESTFGKLFDPIADKMLVITALILVVDSQALPAWMAGVMICREIGVSGLRLIAAEQGISIQVSQLGKIKTATQLLGLECLLINNQIFGWYVKEIGMVSIWVAMLVSLYSGYEYLTDFSKNTKEL